MTPSTRVSASDTVGCTYGSSTRWGIGIIVLIMIALLGASYNSMTASYADTTKRIEKLEPAVQTNYKMNMETREIVGRIDERLKAINESTRRIETTLQSQVKER